MSITVVAQLKSRTCQDQDLRARFTKHSLDSSMLSLLHLKNNGNGILLNYVAPLRTISVGKVPYSFEDGSWQNITSALTFSGAYEDVIALSAERNKAQVFKNAKVSSETVSLNPHPLIDCAALLAKIKDNKVIMINEAHDRTQPRAFILSLLSQLKAKGLTHLAMETLYYKEHNELTVNTGYYTAEPVFGEIVREALRLGLILVPYEDSNAINHSNEEREMVQATNLYNAVKFAPKEAKFLVIAGYSHIAEDYPPGTFNTMAMRFKQLSGINPFTIDQIASLEEQNNDGCLLPHQLGKNKSKILCYINNDNYSCNLAHFDAYILHPKTKFRNCRPTWLACGGIKKENKIKCSGKNVVLIQAYYEAEILSEQDFNICIPADQSFYLDSDNYCHLYLKPGHYIIVFRDEFNNIVERIKLK